MLFEKTRMSFWRYVGVMGSMLKHDFWKVTVGSRVRGTREKEGKVSERVNIIATWRDSRVAD